MFGDTIIEEEEDLEYDRDDDDDDEDDQEGRDYDHNEYGGGGNRVPFAPVEPDRGPSITDRLADYWTDFINYVEDSALWRYLFGQNWYKRFKRGSAWLIDQGSLRFTVSRPIYCLKAND
jgi:hypothetical protein